MFTESIRLLLDKINLVEQEVELGTVHVEHPEDLIFLAGSPGAQRGLQAIVDTVKNPGVITIKYDGYPALIFGRGMDGKFILCDKHMFNKKDGSGHVTSPQAFAQYDRARGIVRGDLEHIIARIWPGLEKAYAGKGFYWGDLMFSNQLQEKNGLYEFRPNPNGIRYTVDADSEIGKLIEGRVAGIAVHQYLQPQATNLKESQPLNGSIGNLKNNSNVAIIPARMPIIPKLKVNKTEIAKVQRIIDKNKQAADAFLKAPPGVATVFPLMCTVFINKKIVARNLNNLVTEFIEFAKNRKMSNNAHVKLFGYNVEDPETKKVTHVPGHFDNNQAGIVAAFEIWLALYNLKMLVVNQLDKSAEASPVKGYLQDGTLSQEGFVAHGVKFINRMGFSAQNLAGRG